MRLQDKINDLEQEILILKAKVEDLSRNTEEKTRNPYSKVGNSSRANIHPVDSKIASATKQGGHVIWNDSEQQNPPYGQEPSLPTAGYNKHTHSRYSGGALIINGLELVKYKDDSLQNLHSQQFINLFENDIEEIEYEGEKIKKIGNLDITFNPITKKWGSAANEIDVETTYLVRRVTEQFNKELKSNGLPEQTIGAIATDTKGQEMKSPLLYALGNFDTLAGRNENLNKTNVYWDDESKCWRFYSIFKPEIEE